MRNFSNEMLYNVFKNRVFLLIFGYLRLPHFRFVDKIVKIRFQNRKEQLILNVLSVINETRVNGRVKNLHKNHKLAIVSAIVCVKNNFFGHFTRFIAEELIDYKVPGWEVMKNKYL